MTNAPTPRSIPSEASTRHFHPVLRPALQALYRARAARLRTLAEGHDLADYLRLAADVADAQAAIAAQATASNTASQPDAVRIDAADPASGATVGAPQAGVAIPPLRIAGKAHWLAHLDAIVAHLAPHAPDAVTPHLDAIKALSADRRIDAGKALAQGDFDQAPPALAPFLWAALSLEMALAARSAPLPVPGAAESANCPMCGSAPVASLIHTGDNQGLRYLHCTLCECEWHVVRAKCTNCGDAKQLDYLSFDSADATVRAESCGHCSGYLKVISQERDPQAETVADDLATLVLDDATAGEGYRRTGFNPFALPSGSA